MIRNSLQVLVGAIIGFLLISLFSYTVPVVISMEANSWKIDNTSISAEISGYKVRECDLIAGSEVGYILNDGLIKQVDFMFQDSDYNSKPVSKFKFSFKRWKWSNDLLNNPSPISVMTTVKHSCSGNIKQTKIGPFKIPQELLQELPLNE